MGVFYTKKKRISLRRLGSVELYININYFTKQIELVVSDSTGEERFLPKELCDLRKKQKGHTDV